jgi:hypothetical protein
VSKLLVVECRSYCNKGGCEWAVATAIKKAVRAVATAIKKVVRAVATAIKKAVRAVATATKKVVREPQLLQ